MDMNTKYFVFRLIGYGFVRPEYIGKLVNSLKIIPVTVSHTGRIADAVEEVSTAFPGFVKDTE